MYLYIFGAVLRRRNHLLANYFTLKVIILKTLLLQVALSKYLTGENELRPAVFASQPDSSAVLLDQKVDALLLLDVRRV